MRTFKDNLNQDWKLSLTLSKVRKYRDKIGLDLLNPDHHLQVLQSLTDRLTFVFLLCEQQAKEIEVDVDEFEDRLMGDGFADAASTAFLEELADFFRKLGQVGQAKMTEKNIKAMTSARESLQEMISTGQFDSMLDKLASEMEHSLQVSDGNG